MGVHRVCDSGSCRTKSVQVLVNGIEAVYGTDVDNSEIASPVYMVSFLGGYWFYIETVDHSSCNGL